MSSGSSQSASSQASSSASSGSEVGRALLQLSKSDLEIQVLKSRILEIEQQQRLGLQEIGERRNALAQTEAQIEAASTRQSEEEERLRVEQRKIVERRKHLSSIGGTRGAKLMEREIDISTRTVQQMEQKVMQMIDETDQIRTKVTRLRAELEAKELEIESASSDVVQTLAECRTRLQGLEERRNANVSALDERIRALYLRVSGKYPGGAIALADAGACRSCYRSLPAQMFNQVMSGAALLQCPGCSRILIPATLASDAENS